MSTDLDVFFKRPHLANSRSIWRDLVQRVEKEQWSYQQFLRTLLEEEVAHCRGIRLNRAVRDAKFPFLRTVEEYDCSYESTLRSTTTGPLPAPDFTTAAELIDHLSVASRAGKRRDALAHYVRPHVLVVDEVGSLTNKHPKHWGDALHDEDLADAIVDRILERGRLLRLDGPSVRAKRLSSDELDVETAPATCCRSSGTARSPKAIWLSAVRVSGVLIDANLGEITVRRIGDAHRALPSICGANTVHVIDCAVTRLGCSAVVRALFLSLRCRNDESLDARNAQPATVLQIPLFAPTSSHGFADIIVACAAKISVQPNQFLRRWPKLPKQLTRRSSRSDLVELTP